MVIRPVGFDRVPGRCCTGFHRVLVAGLLLVHPGHYWVF